MKKLLKICIQIEETAGMIYRRMAQSRVLSRHVRQTLQELANDEDAHANQLRLALRFPEDSVVYGKAQTLTETLSLLQQALKLQTRVEKTEVDDQQAINVGLELEKRFCQVHIANAFDFKEKSFQDMFAAMAKGDELHREKLFRLQKTLP